MSNKNMPESNESSFKKTEKDKRQQSMAQHGRRKPEDRKAER